MYVVIDSEGTVQDLVPNVRAAVEVGSEFGDEVVVEHNNEPESAGSGLSGLGDGNALDLTQSALRRSGLARYAPIPLDMNMSLEDAWAELYDYFPKERFVHERDGVVIDQIVPVRAYDSPEKMSRRLLGQNYKTAKKDLQHEQNTNVQGLSILPAFNMHMAGYKGVNTCVGASAACRKSCLVYSGHNEIDPYNKQVKFARNRALLEKPHAFMRMLAENIARHSRRRTAIPFVRLNVFSDLPWELICPDLFHAFPDTPFYDYSKVPGRDPSRHGIDNYDLTFSYSGTNAEAVAKELGYGRRIAVVFVPPYAIPAKERAEGQGLPATLNTTDFFNSTRGEVVVRDGDVSDVRPYDDLWARAHGVDPAIIVGLRWKIPMGRQKKALAEAKKLAFAVEVVEHNGILIAPVSARQEPIKDPDDALEDFEDEELP